MRRVVFLDVDGVLNTTTFLRDTELPPDDRIIHDRVGILNRILRETGAVCVLSSDWRLSFSAEEMERHLRDGFGFEGTIISSTPINDRSRFSQISDWFDECSETFDDFVIIDDTEVIRDSATAPLHERKLAKRFFFRTDGDVGLTDELADAIIARFAAG